MNSHQISVVALKGKVQIQHMVFMEKEKCSHSILHRVPAKFWTLFAELEDRVSDLQLRLHLILLLESDTC